MSTRSELVQRTLIGDVARSVVILTPIPSIFETLLRHGWLLSTSAGWWRRASNGDTDAVLIPQGGAVADLCMTFHEGVRVELLGYGGALSANSGIGDIVRPSSARLLGSAPEIKLRSGSHRMSVVTVPHLLASYDADARELGGAGVADMEAAYAASAAAKAGIEPIGVRLLITDRVPDAPFFGSRAITSIVLNRRRVDLVEQFIADLAVVM